MLGFNLIESKRHWGEKTVLFLQNTTESTVVSEDLIGLTSIDAVCHLIFFCLEKLLCVTCHLC